MTEHGWTRHRHRCCDQATGPRPAGPVARCGGPALCRECAPDAAIRHSPGSGTFAAPTSPSEPGEHDDCDDPHCASLSPSEPVPSTPRVPGSTERPGRAETVAKLVRELGHFLIQEAALSRLEDFAEHILDALADMGVLAPTDARPRTWHMPTIPADVKALRDAEGRVWHRDGGRWVRDTTAWTEKDPLHLLVHHPRLSPLTEVEETNDGR